MRASEFSRLYQDLIGIRFVDGGRDPAKGLDCLGVVRTYLGRVRRHVPADAFPSDKTETSSDEALEWVEAGSSRWWDFVGDSPRDAILHGDVLFTIGKRDSRPHVSVLVYPAHPKLLLSAALNRGVYTIPLDRTLVQGDLVGVYRLRYEARTPLGQRAA